jgi:hypothetical protein
MPTWLAQSPRHRDVPPGATVLWSRGGMAATVPMRFGAAFSRRSFAEIGLDTLDRDGHPTVRAMRFSDETKPMPTHRLFTFLR